MYKNSTFTSIFTCLFCFVFCTALCAQTATKTQTDTIAIKRAQSAYVEIFGPGLIISGNYDVRFFKKRDGLGARIGIGYISEQHSSATSFPFQINYLLGKGGKFFEIGAGATYLAKRNDPGHYTDYFGFGRESMLLGTLTFGYRYEPKDGGFTFRGSFNPLFNDKIFTPSAGVSLGYSF